MLGLILLPASAVANPPAPRPASPTITLTPSVPSPQQLDTNILWTAIVQNGLPGHTYDYQFSAALQGQNQVVRDFSLHSSFGWVPWQVEGTYVVSVVTRDVTQRPYIVFPPVSAQYVLLPWVNQQGASKVNPTGHPLVALFSAGPCTSGHYIRVRFKSTFGAQSSTTNSVPCSQFSANFLVAGMTAKTQYLMHWEEYGPNFAGASGPEQAFTTGPLPANFPAVTFTVNVPPSGHDAQFPVALFHLLPPAWPIATDLTGSVIWYFPQGTILTRMQPGGNFFTISNTVLAEYDLAGNELLETNPDIISEQLLAKGYPILSSFNIHETRILPNGNILLLGALDQISTSKQGGTPQNPVDILGDMILILDHNMQLVWAWNAFDHQDINHLATLNDICTHNLQGCPDFNHNFLQANDWLHTNSVQYTPDGNLLISQRSQDWVLKINYQNGSGDGSIIWKMGPYGDFTVQNPPGNSCGDPNVFEWFSHQHDASYQVPNGVVPILTVFDDGNTRVAGCGHGDSRGMVMLLNEPARSIYYETVADLGDQSFAAGSAQLLLTPNYAFANFGNPILDLNGSHAAQITETDLNGRIVYEQTANNWGYRMYRQQDLYTPTLP
jgi:arylsulfate sulfotransferase